MPKMELDRTYNEEGQRGVICLTWHWEYVEAKREEKIRSTKKNMRENGPFHLISVPPIEEH